MGDSMKRVFFIIPVYKVEELLDRCVQSVLNQTYKNCEIVLIDDGSPDGCPKLCDMYAAEHKNVKVIHKQNGGLSDARNAGLSYVEEIADEEDYITFLDSDDYLRADFAEKLVSLCENNSCDMAQCEYEKGSSNEFSVNRDCERIFVQSAEEALSGYDLKSLSCAKMYKFRNFKNLRFPDNKINEDEFVTYRAVYCSTNVGFTNEKLYYYYQHQASIMDTIAKKMKNNPHKDDYLQAYEERIAFFLEEDKPILVLKTYEKICVDLILRYCEQMYLKSDERDVDCINGRYKKLYNKYFRQMIKRKGIPIKRRAVYTAFYICPLSAVIAGKLFKLRK